jgi:hypothetical protein
MFQDSLIIAAALRYIASAQTAQKTQLLIVLLLRASILAITQQSDYLATAV